MDGADLARRILRSPIGSLRLRASSRGLVTIELPTLPTPFAPEPQAGTATARQAAERHLDAAEQQLAEYFAGTRRRFDLPIVLDSRGAAFARRALPLLGQIPYAKTWTYGELARRAGSPGAARAAGGVCRRNPLPLVLPCHRVVGAGGSLVGFAGGQEALWIKAALLAFEQSGRPIMRPETPVVPRASCP